MTDRQTSQPRFDLIVALVSGLASVVLVLGTLAVEQIRVTHEIQLWAPLEVEAGDRIPARAIVFTDLEAAVGPHLEALPLRLELLDGGERIAEQVLTPGAFDSLEGELAPVGDVAGPLRLRASVTDDEGRTLATVERLVEVRERVAVLPIRSRLGDALQVLSLSRTPELERAAPGLDVRVEGGACVAEAPCQLLFWVGGSPITPRLTECDAVDVVGTTASDGLTVIEVVVHGPEIFCTVVLEPVVPEPVAAELVAAPPELPELEVVAPEIPEPVAGAAEAPAPTEPSQPVQVGLQIPVALATARIEVEAQEATIRIAGEPPVGRDELIVDVYRRERWIATRSLRRGEQLELEAPGPDLYRVQARADVGSSERAYLRWLVWPSPQLARAEVAAALGIDVGPREVGPSEVGPGGWGSRLAWELAGREGDLIELPALADGLAGDEAVLAGRRTTMRWVAVSGVLLAVLLTLAAVARRGVASAREAREVLLDAGVEGADDRAARWRSWLTVVAFVAAIGLAILLGAAFLVARPFFLG